MREKFLKKLTGKLAGLALAAAAIVLCTPMTASAGTKDLDSGVDLAVYAKGEYRNWDGVSNVAQFVDNKGNFCFAYDTSKYVYIVKTKDGKVVKSKVKLQKPYSLFGAVTCDSKGNYYLVTGRENKTNKTSTKTIFISKFNKNGKLIKTVGDNGSSSLAYYYGSEFYTKIPFDAGNCDAAINGNILTVNYAREMYSGHQSNSVFTINIDTMKKVSVGTIYQSHSFAQRAVPYKDGFIYAGEGDCYSRAFTVTVADAKKAENTKADVFHFWVRKDALNDWDMYALNDNFAHLGGLAVVNDSRVALVGTSAKDLNSKAANQPEQLFIQIFNPAGNLSSKSGYVTQGKRTGYSGPNGRDKVANYGVKWLTSFDKNTSIQHPQVVSNGKGTILILFEKYVQGEYKGVYCIKLDKKGNVKKKATRVSADAYLNPCRMPIYSNGKVYWAGNKVNDSQANVYIFSMEL